MPISAKKPSWRVPVNLRWLTALALSTGLSGCASLVRYEQSFAPPHPATAAPAAALRAAEARGYEEGLDAGKRIQARHDHALAEAARDKTAAAAAMMAQQAIEETQDMQAINKLCDPPPKPVTPPPAVGTAPAARSSSPDGFAPSGPARPLSPGPDPLPNPF